MERVSLGLAQQGAVMGRAERKMRRELRAEQEWNRQAEAEEAQNADEFFANAELDEHDEVVPLEETAPADPWDKRDATPARRSKKPADAWQNERLGTVHDVARFLAAHFKTVEHWRRDEGLPCVRINRAIRYVYSDVSRWVSARKEGV